MERQVLVESAKTGRSKCKKCNKMIAKGQLRVKVIDDREFQNYLRRNPDARHCEGFSRGYFETEKGCCISIKKYFVHLGCYKPIYPHPMELKYFKLSGVSRADRELFNTWLGGDAVPVKSTNKKGKSK